jgi:hypothetical protein
MLPTLPIAAKKCLLTTPSLLSRGTQLMERWSSSPRYPGQMSGNPTNQELARCCQGRLLLVSGFINIYDQGEFILP